MTPNPANMSTETPLFSFSIERAIAGEPMVTKTGVSATIYNRSADNLMVKIGNTVWVCDLTGKCAYDIGESFQLYMATPPQHELRITDLERRIAALSTVAEKMAGALEGACRALEFEYGKGCADKQREALALYASLTTNPNPEPK